MQSTFTRKLSINVNWIMTRAKNMGSLILNAAIILKRENIMLMTMFRYSARTQIT